MWPDADKAKMYMAWLVGRAFQRELDAKVAEIEGRVWMEGAVLLNFHCKCGFRKSCEWCKEAQVFLSRIRT